jgi:hypothetical protein
MSFNPADPLVQMLIARSERIERGYLKYESHGYVMTDEQLKELNEALGLVKDKTYRPYCLRNDKGCDMPRVFIRADGRGFQCPTCGNPFGFNLQSLPT